jgi:hypothetical protein
MTNCKHDWHFIEGTDRLQCARCKAETGPRTPDQLMQDLLSDVTLFGMAWQKGGKRIDPRDVYAVPTEQMQQYKLHDSRPNSIIFHCAVNDEQTAVLRISKDGIWANPDVPVDDAAKAVLAALDGPIKGLETESKERILRLEGALTKEVAINAQLLEALEFIANRQDLMFAECSDAEEIIEAARAAIAAAKGGS